MLNNNILCCAFNIYDGTGSVSDTFQSNHALENHVPDKVHAWKCTVNKSDHVGSKERLIM